MTFENVERASQVCYDLSIRDERWQRDAGGPARESAGYHIRGDPWKEQRDLTLAANH